MRTTTASPRPATVNNFRFTFFRHLLATLGLFAILAAPSIAAPAGPRIDRLIDDGWRFVRADVPDSPEASTFDDAAWQSVTLPHTWNAEDGADGPQTKYYRGVGWYRRHLTLDSSLAGKILFLRFDGAATVTDVFVNGVSIGEHRGNFAAFCFDVSKQLKVGRDNVIAVKVNNAHQPDIAPLSGDFTVYGGLYRDVHLLALSPLSITPLDDGGPGVYIRPVAVREKAATVSVRILLRNETTSAITAKVHISIADAAGKLAGSKDLMQEVAPGATVPAESPVAIDPRYFHLWNGVSDPYLYHVTVEVSDGKQLTDVVTQPLGLRSFHVDPDQGLLLNGARYALHGVNRHQDRMGKGWAISAADHEQDYKLVRDMGSTGIRLSHYQHAQEFYDLCDRGGLVVWAELPQVNSIAQTPEFATNAHQQLRELIKQNFNHPSIFFWSLYNELSFKNWTDPTQWQLLVDLNKEAHDLDPGRLTTAATSQAIDRPISFITDVIAVNRYPGWYGGKPGDWPKMIDDMHAKYPKLCIGISEYGAGASVIQHENLPANQPKAGGKWHPEEWQATVHEDAWMTFSTRPYIWGTFLWAMYDFGSDGRNEGDTPGRNDKGMVSFDRATEKDAFFWYQSNWNDPKALPIVHITSARFASRPAQPIHVKVYSNCATVELTVNGKVFPPVTAANHLFLWTDVPLEIGDNVVVARTVTPGGKTVTDTCRWVGVAQPVLAPIAPLVAPTPTKP